MPEEAWIYEDAAFRPHPKQHQQSLRLEFGEKDAADAEQGQIGSEAQEAGGMRAGSMMMWRDEEGSSQQEGAIYVDDEYPRPKYKSLDDVLHVQEDVVEGESAMLRSQRKECCHIYVIARCCNQADVANQ